MLQSATLSISSYNTCKDILACHAKCIKVHPLLIYSSLQNRCAVAELPPCYVSSVTDCFGIPHAIMRKVKKCWSMVNGNILNSKAKKITIMHPKAQLMTFIWSEFPLTIKTYPLHITVSETWLNNCKECVEYVCSKGN